MFWYTFIILLLFIIFLMIDLIDSVNLLYLFSSLLLISFSINNIGNLTFLLSNSFHPIIILLFNLSIINTLTKKSNISQYIYTLLSKTRAKYLLIIITLLTSLIFSSVINNSIVVSTLIPIISDICKKENWNDRNLLISVSYISILGGTLTLLGSSTNLLAASLLKPELNLEIFSLFKFTIITIIPCFIYLFIYNLLDFNTTYLPCFLKKSPEISINFICLSINKSCKLIGKNIKDNKIQELDGYQLSAIKKKNTFSYLLPRSLNIIDRGDILVYLGINTYFKNSDFIKNNGLTILNENNKILADKEDLFINPNIAIGTVNWLSILSGKCIKDINFKQEYHLILLGIIRNQQYLTKNIKNLKIKTNDKIIVSGLNGNYEMIMELNNLCTKTQIISYPKLVKNNLLFYNDLAIGIFFLGLIITGFYKIDSTLISTIFIYFYYLIGIVHKNDIIIAFNNQRSIILGTFSSLLFSNCLVKSGLINTLAKYLIKIKYLNNLYLYFIIHLVSSILSIFLNNSSVIAIFIPIIKLVFTNNLYKISLIVIHGANCCFSSPTGYHTNLMVFNKGGYSCKDFFIIGFPLQIITSLLFTLVIYYI